MTHRSESTDSVPPRSHGTGDEQNESHRRTGTLESKTIQQMDSTSEAKHVDPSPGGRTLGTIPRRHVLSGMGALAIGLPTTVSASDTSEDVPTPRIEGPIKGGEVTGQPQTASLVDVSAYGYTEREYFISGVASTVGPPVPENIPPPLEEREELPDESAEYKTRILVYRPTDLQQFNGTVVVSWVNAVLGLDSPGVWANMYDHVMREGYAFVIVSTQKSGVDDSPVEHDLRTWDPERYGELHHPGNAYAYGIFPQAIKGLVTQSGPDPLSRLAPERILAVGLSRSSNYLQYYINNLQEHHQLIDGFVPFLENPQQLFVDSDQDEVRDDLVPMLWVNTESEAVDEPQPDVEEPQPDSGFFKLWRVAGASHLNYWLMQYNIAMVARDHEGEDVSWDESAAGQYGQRDDGMYGVCPPSANPPPSFNYFPTRYAYRAAVQRVDEWVRNGDEPPSAPRFEHEDGELQRDKYGNVVGGMRLPPIDVPVAFYDAVLCGLVGRTYQLGDAVLRQLYPTHEEYITQMQTAANKAVEKGYLVPADAEDLMSRVEASPISTETT